MLHLVPVPRSPLNAFNSGYESLVEFPVVLSLTEGRY